MRKILLKLSLLFIAFVGSTFAKKNNCVATIVKGRTVYNLLQFSTSGSFKLNNLDNVEDQIQISLCTQQVPGCSTNKTYASRTLSNDITFCDDVAINDPEYEFINDGNHEEGLRMIFPKTQGQSEKKYKLSVDLKCDKEKKLTNETSFEYTLTSSSEDESLVFIQVVGASQFGCPVASLDSLIVFMEDNEILFVSIFFCLGIFINLFGLKMFNTTVFIISCIAGTLGSATLFYHFTDLNTQEWILWFIFAVCLCIGCGAGFLAVRHKQLGFFGIGFGIGVILALLLYQYLLANLSFDHLGEAFLYGFSAILGVAGGLLAVKYWKGMIILATSFIGAYLIIRSVSVYLGGFPSELEISEGFAEFEWSSIAYLAALLLLTIIGCRYQYINKTPEDEAKLVADELHAGSRYREILLENI